MTEMPPEWLPDPLGRYDHRFWNGSEWTEHVANGGQAEVDPLGISPTRDLELAEPVPKPDLLPSTLEDGAHAFEGEQTEALTAERDDASAQTRVPAPISQPGHHPGPTPAPIPPLATPVDTAGTLRGKGVTGTVKVDDHFVTIARKGAMAKMNYGWTRGEKRIPIDTIAAVQFKKAGMSRGYIQFTLAGGNESTRGVMAATQDENSVLFTGGHESEFRAIRDHIERRIASRQTASRAPASVAPAGPADLATQLRALAALRDEGLLTEEEFAAQKAKLL